MTRDLIQEMGRVHKPNTKRHNKHWPLEGKKIWCCLCSKNKETVMELSDQNATWGLHCSVLHQTTFPKTNRHNIGKDSRQT